MARHMFRSGATSRLGPRFRRRITLESNHQINSMIQLLAHRGNIAGPDRLTENTQAVFVEAFRRGFGIETDVRDAANRLVISHDLPNDSAFLFEELLAAYIEGGYDLPLAINIKADGLRGGMKSLFGNQAGINHFFFDMSVPETLAYRREGLRFFSRESEYEPAPALYRDSAGVWMDMFESDWITSDHIARHIDNGKQVALVSPDLHGRPYLEFWARLRDSELCKSKDLMLCTDYPEAARTFFS